MRQRTFLAFVLFGAVSFMIGGILFSTPAALRASPPFAKATPTLNKQINADQIDNLHASKNPTPNRLLALDGNAKFPLSAMPDGVQLRVSGNCVVGSAVRAVNADGTVECETIPAGVPTPTAVTFPTPVPTATAITIPSPFPTPTANPADITSVIAGNGLTGGGTSGDVTLDADYAGTGSANTLARSDHNHYAQEGWVKAMVHAYASAPTVIIDACYNSQQNPPTTTAPCGITATYNGFNNYTFDFGFDASSRFIVLTTENYNSVYAATHNGTKINVKSCQSSCPETGFTLIVY